MEKRMGPSVYLETSVVSYLASQPSRDLVTAAHQQITHEWWLRRRAGYEMFVSPLVLDEAAAGDPAVAARRADFLRGIPILGVTEAVRVLAVRIVREVPLPSKAGADSVHIAVAACHGMDFLLTWNCAHIANAQLRPRVERVCRLAGYDPPVLCTPDELMGGESRD